MKKLLIVLCLIIFSLNGCSAKESDINKNYVNTENDNNNEDNKERESDLKISDLTQTTIISESEHFIIQHESSESSVEKIIKILEDNYKRITILLQIDLDSKAEIYILPDLKSFHEFIGLPDSPDWVVGFCSKETGVISFVSPNNPGTVHSYDSIMKVAVHEFVHLAVNKININIPEILNEGVAVFLAEQHEGVKDIIGTVIRENKFPPINELLSFTNENIYSYGYVFVEYIVFKYNYEGLLEYIKNPDIKSVFGVSDNDFYVDLLNYLKNNY